MITPNFFPGAAPVARLIEAFHKLPGIGPKSAQRLTYYLIRTKDEEARSLAEAVLDVKDRIQFCSVCQNITETDPCALCDNMSRDHSTICIVEEPLDALALERTRSFRGVYHILHGAISPLNNVGPEDLKLTELLDRLKDGQVKEVIMATSATVDGQTTAHYLCDRLAGTGVQVTELAHGVPVGGELDYLDDGTLGAAIKARQPV